MMHKGHLRGQRQLRHCRRAILWLWLAVAVLALGSFTSQAQPVNDNIADATVIVGPYGTAYGDNSGASGELSEIPCSLIVVDTNEPPPVSSVWFRWRAPASGYAYFDTHYSPLDTVLTVYEDECYQCTGTYDRYLYLYEYGCNDDYRTNTWGVDQYTTNSLVGFYAYQGYDYYVRVDSKDVQGPITLNWYGLTNAIGVNQIQLSASSYTVSENGGFLLIPVEYSGGTNIPVSVDFYLLNGSAVFGADYDNFLDPGFASGTMVFDGNKPYDGTVAVSYIALWVGDNGYPNPPKTLQVVLANPVGCDWGMFSGALVSITDNEASTNANPAGVFNFATTSYIVYDYEDDISSGPNTSYGGLLTVIRTNGSTGRVMVDYSVLVNYGVTNYISNGKYYPVTDSSGYVPAIPYYTYYYTTNGGSTNYLEGEYYPTSGTLLFDDYQMSASFYVETLPYGPDNYGDGYNDNYSYFNVTLSNPRPAPEEELARPGFLVPTLGLGATSMVQIAHTIYSPVMAVSTNNVRTTNITYVTNITGTVTNRTTNTVILTNAVVSTNLTTAPDTGYYTLVKKNYRFEEDYQGYSATFYVYHFGSISKDQKVIFRTIDQNTDAYAEYEYTLQPGSDYADPDQKNYPSSPGATAIAYPQDYKTYSKELTFKKTDSDSQSQTITINMSDLIVNDKVPEFNEDICFELVKAQGNDNDDVSSLGSTANLTILFDDQPAGAADRYWNPMGMSHTAPPYNYTPGANNIVNSVFVDHNQKSVIGGNFTTYNGYQRYRVARISTDGLLDETFQPGNGANDSVSVVTMYPYPSPVTALNDKIFIGGNFTSYGGMTRNRIARLNGDGSLDDTFNPGEGANGPVKAVLPLLDGSVIVAGDFTRFNGVARNRIARLNQDGTLNLAFDPGTGADDTILALGLDAPGKIEAGANRAANNTQPPEYRTNIQTSAKSGTINITFKPGCDPDNLRVYYGTNRIFESGMVDEYGGVLTNCTTTNYVAPFNYQIAYGPGADTDISIVINEDATNAGTAWNYTATVDNLAGMRIVAGGKFNTFDGVERNGIVRLTDEGKLDPAFDPGSGTDGGVYAVAVQKDSKVLIGGAFSDCNFRSRNNIARLNANGTLDIAYDPGLGFDNAVYAIKLQADGKAYVGGRFTSYDTVRRMGVARLMTNGVIDTSFMDTAYNQFAGLINNVSYEPPSFVSSIDLQSTNYVMIGGSFTNIGGHQYSSGNYTRAQKIMRMNLARLIGGYTPGPGASELDHPSYEANENAGVNTVTLRRIDGNLGTIGSYVLTSNRVAQAGIDYFFSDAPVTWNEWSVNGPRSVGYVGSTYMSVSIINDLIINGDRSLDLLLMNPFGSLNLGGEYIPLGAGRGRMQVPLVIHNDDFPKGVLTFSQPTYYVNENGGNVIVTIVRTNGSDGRVGVTYTTGDGSAVAPGDYTPQSGTITLESGDTTASVSIPIIDDAFAEFDESFKVVLTNVTGGATLANGALTVSAPVTIVDNDFTAGRLNFQATNFNVMENSNTATIIVTRSGGNVGAISASVTTYDGSAHNGIDYLAATNTLHWADGDIIPKTFTVPILNNDRVEGNRTVDLRMFNPSIPGLFGLLATNVTLTIVEDDSYGRLGFSYAGYDANENGTNVLITVVRSGGLAGTVSADYGVIGGTAVAGQDYLPFSGTLTFVPGQSSTNFTVRLINNSLSDGDRAIVIGLMNFHNASSALITETALTIIDDEGLHTPAGSLDTVFNPLAGPDKAVYSLLLLTNGNILLGGDFNQVRGIIRHRMAQFLPNGTLDASFDVGGGPNRSVRSMLLQPDGKVIVGGLFTSIDGIVRNHIANDHFAVRLQ
jgi:uncharacterized delta-60 repeat protein